MAYDRQFLRVEYLFQVLTSEEVAVTSVNYSVIPGWTTALEALEDIDMAGGTGAALFTAFTALMDDANLFWANYSQFYAVKIAAIGTNGLYLGDAKVYETTPEAGTSTTTLPQSTVVLSLRSNSILGSANFGRMYLPHTREALVSGTPTSILAGTDVIVESAHDYFDATTAALNADISETVQPFIMSNQAPKPSKPVIRIAVGTVTDTQRRRRNRIPEEYSFATL